MSQNENSKAGQEQDIWGDVDSRQADQGGDGRPDIDLGEDNAADSAPLEVEAKPVKKFKAVYVIALIGLAAVGFVSHIGFSLYQQLYGTDVAASADQGVSLVDTTSSLLINPGAQAVSTVPTGSAETVPSDPSIAQAPVIAPPAPVVSQDVATLAPTAAAAVPAEAAPPPVCPPVAAAPVCPSVASAASGYADLKERKPVKTRQADQRPKRPKAPKPEGAVIAAKAPASSPVLTETTPGRLAGLKLLAIEPKTGSHQQAWIRDAAGKMFIVREGDLIRGSRVTSVRFDEGVVQTVAGEISK